MQAGATAIVSWSRSQPEKSGQWKPERPSMLTVGASFERRRTGLKEMARVLAASVNSTPPAAFSDLICNFATIRKECENVG
jgi:hypothetical protein